MNRDTPTSNIVARWWQAAIKACLPLSKKQSRPDIDSDIPVEKSKFASDLGNSTDEENIVKANVTTRGKDKKINIVLTGTSNSVFVKGFSSGLAEHPSVETFINRSLGASGTVSITYHAHDLDLTNADYIFIDYCINETIMLFCGGESIDNTYNQLAVIIDKASKAGCVPILVNLPTPRDWGKTTPMMQMIEREFAARGVGIFDVAHLLEETSRVFNIEPDTFFNDPMHLTRQVGYAVGRILIDNVEKLRMEGAVAKQAQSTDASVKATGYIPATSLESRNTFPISRRNRLVSVDLIQMPSQAEIQLAPDAGAPLILRGVIYNAARSKGTLTLTDGSPLLSTNDPAVYGGAREIVLVGIATVVSDRKLLENTDILFQQHEDDPETVFELAGFVVEYADARASLHVVKFEDSRNLIHESVGHDDLEKIQAAVLASKQPVASQQPEDAVHVPDQTGVTTPVPHHLTHAVPLPFPASDQTKLRVHPAARSQLVSALETENTSDNTVRVSLACGQSLSVWATTGGPKGRAWSARMHWSGTPVDSRLLMLNGGILMPGFYATSVLDLSYLRVKPEEQASFMEAYDILYHPLKQLDRDGNETGKKAFSRSSSPAIAFMIRRALCEDGYRGKSKWLYTSIGMGNQPIDFFLPSLNQEMGGWYRQIFEETLKNILQAAGPDPVEIVDIPFEHGESDGQEKTRDEYRQAIDAFVSAATQSVTRILGQTTPPVFVQTQIGCPLLTTGAKRLNRNVRDVVDVSFAILDKGISLNPEDTNYICSGPRYDLTYASINHLDHYGYLHNDERRAFVLNENKRLRATGELPKWLPCHVVSASLHQDGEGHFIILNCHVPFAPLQIDFQLIPELQDYGIKLSGDGATPQLLNCSIGADGKSVILRLSGPWNATQRTIGVATRARLSRQGWLTDDETPTGKWRHVGVGTNIRDSAPWASVVTNTPLPNWLCSQVIEIVDCH